MRVVYTDPAWALDEGLRLDPRRAALERDVFGPDITVEIVPFDGSFVGTGPRLYDAVRGADAVVVYRCRVTPELVSMLTPTCRVVARSGVGLDNLNGSLLSRAGIYAFNIPDYCGDEVSTHTVALLLALERGVCVQDRLVRANRWGIHLGGVPRRTATRTAGIVGFGRIGRASTRKLETFYRDLLAYDPYVPGDVMASHGVTRVDDLGELFAAADAVVLHAALTEETDHIIDRSMLSRARPGCLLVNTARGRLVDVEAVLEALESGLLAGYAADVFAPEDPNESPVARKLLERDDVVVSSHRAFLSVESELSLRRRVAQGVRTVLTTGLPPPEGRVA
jgi:phosphoglycerate dehydrogenase-like enzyme